MNRPSKKDRAAMKATVKHINECMARQLVKASDGQLHKAKHIFAIEKQLTNAEFDCLKDLIERFLKSPKNWVLGFKHRKEFSKRFPREMVMG